MEKTLLRVLALLFLTAHSLPATALQADKCVKDKAAPQTLCACDIKDLRPTQSAVGMFEVKRKQQEVAERLQKKAKKVDKFLRKEFEPVVIGPGNEFYIIDHHHLALALWNEGVKTTYCRIEENLSKLSPEAFWKEMKSRNFVYLNDENGKGPIDPQKLPKTVMTLKDDPYRSFAGRVRKEGGYKKSKTTFSEFAWAQFFRERIAKPKDEAEFLRSLAKAVELAKSPEAKTLSGYNGGDR